MPHSDGLTGLIDQAAIELDHATLNLKSVAEHVDNVRGLLMEAAIYSDLEIKGGMVMTEAMDKQIDIYLKQVFNLRVALRNYRGKL